MTSSIYGSLERDHRDDALQKNQEGFGGGGGGGARERLGQSQHSLDLFDFPDVSTTSSTQPASPVDSVPRNRTFRPIRENDDGVAASAAGGGGGGGGGGGVSSGNGVARDRQFRFPDADIDFPTTVSSLSRSTTSDSFDAFSLLDEVEFPPPNEDAPPPPPCPSGLYGSLMTSQHHGGANNLVNAAFGGFIGGGVGKADRPFGVVGSRASPSSITQKVAAGGGGKSTAAAAADSISLVSNLSAVSSEGRPCLLEVNRVTLADMDLFSGVWVSAEEAEDEEGSEAIPEELRFEGGSRSRSSAYVVRKDYGKFLRSRCELTLKVERNLEGAISHAVPDFNVAGELSSVHCSIDVAQYQLIRGILDHNLGEQFAQFAAGPEDGYLVDPVLVVGPEEYVYKSISIAIDLTNVTVELLVCHETDDDPLSVSLAKMDFLRSRLSFESYSDGSKDVDLVSREIKMFDTRYPDEAVNNRPNVFTLVLRPKVDPRRQKPPTSQKEPTAAGDTLQMELHYRSTKEVCRFTILLNNMRLMGIFDWLLAVYDFLLTGSVDPFDHDLAGSTKKPGERGTSTTTAKEENQSPLPSGVITKTTPRSKPPPTSSAAAAAAAAKPATPFELKLNITETDFVVVERQDKLDTHAVILKTTAVFNQRPHNVEKPVTCSLQSMEVFSCSLGAESETELSIVDPVTIGVEMCRPAASVGRPGLLAATEANTPPMLDVAIHQNLQIRLSYYDVKLFLAIANSLPAQTSSADSKRHSDAPRPVAANAPPPPAANATAHLKSKFSATHVSKLKDMGFAEADVLNALEAQGGNLNESANWLLARADPRAQKGADAVSSTSAADASDNAETTTSSISELKFRAPHVCVVLIDDCKDIDIPLAEVSLSNVVVDYRMLDVKDANGSSTLSVDYYNRSLSGWEPFVEPWKAKFSFSKSSSEAMKIAVQSDDILNLNVTSCFVDLYQETFKRWTEDFYGLLKASDSVTGSTLVEAEAELAFTSGLRRRMPFVPFELRNKTGVPLWFATITCAPDKFTSTSGGMTFRPEFVNTGDWRKVAPDQAFPFTFEDRSKQRHRNTRELRVHQVVAQVRGWNHVTPVSVDKVGTFFRVAKLKQPETKLLDVGASSSNGAALETQVIVFDVSLEGAAKKVITVRSDLRITNRLGDDVELMLDKGQIERGGLSTRGVLPTKVLRLADKETLPIPLPYTSAKMWIRPLSWKVDFCNPSVFWPRMLKPGELTDLQLKCNEIVKEGEDGDNGDLNGYRFSVAVRKENFPSSLFERNRGGRSRTPEKKIAKSNSEGMSFARLQHESNMSRSNSGSVAPSSLITTAATTTTTLAVAATTTTTKSRSSSEVNAVQPGHHLVLLPPVILVNLLPCEMNYYLKQTPVRGCVSSGESVSLRTVDLSKSLELGIQLENHPKCKELHIPPGTTDYVVKIRLYDSLNRPLELTVRIKARKGGSLR